MQQKIIKSELSACADLTLSQSIPAASLEAMEEVYSSMLKAVREALAERRRLEARHKASIARVSEAKIHYASRCLQIRRWRRKHKVSIKALATVCHNQYFAREDLSHGNALARARLADVKKATIIKLYCGGCGVRPVARLITARFGSCSPSYAAKIIKSYKEAIQPELSLPLLRRIK